MLLGNAMTLAYEVGVFDEKSVDELQQENPGMPLDTLQAYLSRKEHLKDLILIYVTQTSGRVGITSMTTHCKPVVNGVSNGLSLR